MPKRKRGDRRDAVWLKDIPSMNRIMPCIMPNRADNEAYISFDLEPIWKRKTRGGRRISIPSST